VDVHRHSRVRSNGSCRRFRIRRLHLLSRGPSVRVHGELLLRASLRTRWSSFHTSAARRAHYDAAIAAHCGRIHHRVDFFLGVCHQTHLTNRWSQPPPGARSHFEMIKTVLAEASLAPGGGRSAFSR